MYKSTLIRMHIRIYAKPYTNLCSNLRLYECTYESTLIRMYVQIYAYTNVRTNLRFYECTYESTHIRMYVSGPNVPVLVEASLKRFPFSTTLVNMGNDVG